MRVYNGLGKAHNDPDWDVPCQGKITRIDAETGEVTLRCKDPGSLLLSWLQCGWDVTLVPEHFERIER